MRAELLNYCGSACWLSHMGWAGGALGGGGGRKDRSYRAQLYDGKLLLRRGGAISKTLGFSAVLPGAPPWSSGARRYVPTLIASKLRPLT